MVWSGRGSNQQTSVFVGSKDVIVWSAWRGGGRSQQTMQMFCAVYRRKLRLQDPQFFYLPTLPSLQRLPLLWIRFILLFGPCCTGLDMAALAWGVSWGGGGGADSCNDSIRNLMESFLGCFGLLTVSCFCCGSGSYSPLDLAARPLI